MNVKAVLFDLDGVLVDSKKMHHDAWCVAVQQILGVTIDVFPASQVSGKSPRLIAQLLCEKYGDASKHSEVLVYKNAHLEKHSESIALLPGVMSIFDVLKDRKIPYGIASNASKHFVAQCIQKGNLQVSHFYGYEDYIQAKPNPEPYQKLATTLGIATEEFKDVVVFEDSATGITAALNAGMQVIHIASYSVVSNDLLAKTDHSFDNVGEALGLFE